MILKKCPKCKEYNLTEKCRKCSEKTQDAHYKFIHLRDEDEIHPKFERR
ncbi:MAG: hypothetical protein Q7S33_06040 [Nanoarchaeota archaeon]|nr:hypothetical protein [Nanoarchaeota archaeon]